MNALHVDLLTGSACYAICKYLMCDHNGQVAILTVAYFSFSYTANTEQGCCKSMTSNVAESTDRKTPKFVEL